MRAKGAAAGSNFVHKEREKQVSNFQCLLGNTRVDSSQPRSREPCPRRPSRRPCGRWSSTRSTVSCRPRRVRHPIFGDYVEVESFYGRPSDVPQSDVDAATEVFSTWARSELHLDWMIHGYRALRAGVIRQTGSMNPDAMTPHDEAVAAFQGSCLHGYIPTGVTETVENPVLGTYRRTAERACKYCGNVDSPVVSSHNHSGD